MIRPTRVAAGAVVAGLVAGLAAGAEHRSARDGLSASVAPGQGGGGVGDPYYPTAGNGGYDVGHYALSLEWSARSDVLSGTATITATATEALDRFHLDLSPELTVATVEVAGTRARHSRSDGELVVTPSAPLVADGEFTVEVDYAGVPKAMSDAHGMPSGWIRTDDGVIVLSEPTGAPSWFPANDHPSDKATYSVSITVQDGLTAVGNGELLSKSSKDGQTTVVWEERSPMATYLVTVCIGPFEIAESETDDGTPLYVAVDPREVADSADSLALLPEIVEFEAGLFGPYPFDTAGAIVDSADVGYALETQTKPVYGFAPFPELIVHEMAHQWFGNSVTPESWKDIWLNEGFATYAEWLWSEHVGDATPQEIFDTYNTRTPAAEDFWNPPPGDPGPDALFADSVYVRGAMTLHALRMRIGDAAFWRLVKEWTSTYRHGNASTADFVAMAEEVSGKSLDRLFAIWLYLPGKPTGW